MSLNKPLEVENIALLNKMHSIDAVKFHVELSILIWVDITGIQM